MLERTNVCPRRSLPPEYARWIQLYGHYKAGHLLVAGGLMDQPAKYVTAMHLIATTVSTADG